MDTLALPKRQSSPTRSIASSTKSFISFRSHRSDFSSRNPRKPKSSRIPLPSHRHAAPSAPWPWVDLEDEVDQEQLNTTSQPVPEPCKHDNTCHHCWKNYPQSLFPNWTARQVKKSKIYDAITQYNKSESCTLYQVDVDNEGGFTEARTIVVENGLLGTDALWKECIAEKRDANNRVRAIFLHNTSGPVLQMLGTKYNIEPFFWSSALNWIPSRFQEAVSPGNGDHITLTLTFVRSMAMNKAEELNDSVVSLINTSPSTLLGNQKIDTHAPLLLNSNNRLLVLDLLAVHLVRNTKENTIISYHPTNNQRATQAKFLYERIRFAGQSVYWQTIFRQSGDPTFLLLTFIWHAIYAWDQALEDLYGHITYLETRVMATTEMRLTHELHTIRAHHLHYTSLLEDFSKHVRFVRDIPNPAMQAEGVSDQDKLFTKNTMDRECSTLLSEIKRLQSDLNMQERRLKNVMGLVFSSVNITDSRFMREMTEAAVKDSAAMKQVAYLSMVFLPASFVAAVFGMNVKEINPGTLGTLSHYAETALPLTFLTIWIIIAFQNTYFFDDGTHFLIRLLWPVYLPLKYFGWFRSKPKDEEDEEENEEINEEKPNGGFEGITVMAPEEEGGGRPVLPPIPHHPLVYSPFQR